MDTPIRSISKAISWRMTGTLDTILISFLITGSTAKAFSIGAVELATKTVLYYFHERVWNRISLGTRHLAKHPKVAWVRYPGLPDDPTHATAARYLKRGFGGMVVFGIKGGYDAAVRLIDSIRLFSHLANVGDAKSLILHPASTSHSQLTEEQQRAGGLTPDLVRLSIGLEHPDDLVEALYEALTKA